MIIIIYAIITVVIIITQLWKQLLYTVSPHTASRCTFTKQYTSIYTSLKVFNLFLSIIFIK